MVSAPPPIALHGQGLHTGRKRSATSTPISPPQTVQTTPARTPARACSEELAAAARALGEEDLSLRSDAPPRLDDAALALKLAELVRTGGRDEAVGVGSSQTGRRDAFQARAPPVLKCVPPGGGWGPRGAGRVGMAGQRGWRTGNAASWQPASNAGGQP